MKIRRAHERGHADHGWLDTHHSFSFADYHDPAHMGYRALRVINEDRVAPGQGFGAHGHRDMEIISYVLDGGLEHKDSTGAGGVIQPGDVQRMSAGTGVRHSEYNASNSAPLHFLQIWILPDRRGYAPSYEHRRFSDEHKRGKLCLIASAGGAENSVVIHQDAKVYASLLEDGDSLTFEPAPSRYVYIHIAKGSISVNGELCRAGDGVAIDAASDEAAAIALRGHGGEVLLFDLG